MFGLKTKAQRKEAEEAQRAKTQALEQAVHRRLYNQVEEVVAEAIARHGLNEDETQDLMVKAGGAWLGFKAVLEDHRDYNGGEMRDLHLFIQRGAMIAQAAGNMAVITGEIENPNTRGDISAILGMGRDGTQRPKMLGQG